MRQQPRAEGHGRGRSLVFFVGVTKIVQPLCVAQILPEQGFQIILCQLLEELVQPGR
jgi:hypothetical protein